MKKLQLILTNPCTENWDHMQPSGAERYCDHCEKNIIDLTTKSDVELIDFFKKKKENVCGRLYASQLNRELVLPRSRASWHWLLPLAMGAIVGSPAQAKELRPVVLQESQPVALPETSIRLALTSPSTRDTLRGTVIDEHSNQLLKGVKVREKGFENVLAITDDAGKFKLDIKEGSVANVYTFELNGYSRLEMQPAEDMVIKLYAERRIMLGGVSTISPDQAPLYVIHMGKKSYVLDLPKMNEINPDWIERIDVLKDAKATAVYGARAANGVILIEIKKAYEKQIDLLEKTKVLKQ